MSERRRFQRIAVPILLVLFALVAIQQLRGLGVFHDHHHHREHRIEHVHRHNEHRDNERDRSPDVHVEVEEVVVDVR
jgi:hypothetical protein